MKHRTGTCRESPIPAVVAVAESARAADHPYRPDPAPGGDLCVDASDLQVVGTGDGDVDPVLDLAHPEVATEQLVIGTFTAEGERLEADVGAHRETREQPEAQGSGRGEERRAVLQSTEQRPEVHFQHTGGRDPCRRVLRRPLQGELRLGGGGPKHDNGQTQGCCEV